jgi:predicted GNAT family acetyltransferase
MNNNKRENKKMNYPFTKTGDSSFKLKPATLNDVAQLKECIAIFQKDYEKVDNLGLGVNEDNIERDCIKYITQPEQGRALYLAQVNGTTVGHLETYQQRQQLVIYTVSVLPEYRNFGVAKRMYQKAITELGANSISLTYHRIRSMKMIDYWREVGFNHITLVPGQTGGDLGLALLIVNSLDENAIDWPLHHRGVKECSEHSYKIMKKLAKYMPDTKLAMTPEYQDVVYQVMKNHFHNKKLLKHKEAA